MSLWQMPQILLLAMVALVFSMRCNSVTVGGVVWGHFPAIPDFEVPASGLVIMRVFIGALLTLIIRSLASLAPSSQF